jgi:cysteine desulfurase/selenocysteine lyase
LHQYKIPEGILKIQDVSQSLAHLPIHAEYYDFVYGTGHKVYADTGIGFLWGKMQHLKKLTPAIGGGGAINWVGMDDFEF